MMFFEQYNEFVANDVRSSRGTTTVTSESMTKRCEALLPKWMVEGKTILDLGHCLGAFGHWALANGAKHYTGVDIQQSFCDKSKELLSSHWSNDKFTIEREETLEYLICSAHQSYDIVIASGIIHCYVNSIDFVEKLAAVAKEYVVIETQEADETSGIPSIQFKIFNMVSDSIGSPYAGWSSAIGYNALRAVMGENGFDVHGGRIHPKKIIGSHDAYNDEIEINTSDIYAAPKRYMVRYKRTNRIIKSSLQYSIVSNKRKTNAAYVNSEQSKITKAPVWEFDSEVANRFQSEALSNIPDYDRVISMCLDVAEARCNKNSVIVDVGSALGYTMEKFLNAGYANVFGVESSQHMLDGSSVPNTILSDVFPKNLESDLILANWTLHFVNERKQYIQDVYNALRSNGTFIISDKTPQSEVVKEMYYDFKRSNGVRDEYIYEKEKKLQGYMTLLPIEWYTDTLKEVGFKNIQIINSKFGFITFYCEKL